MRISDWSSDVCSSDLDVDAEILDDEPIALGEIGLRGIDVEPRSEGEAREEGRADPALVAQCLERADRCLPAEILVDHPRHAGGGARGDPRPGLGASGQERRTAGTGHTRGAGPGAQTPWD